MRVIGGEFSGIKLGVSQGVRPTTDRVRESVFSSLDARGYLVGATVVDLFAGSGALGIEAVSRGADQAIFVENNRKAIRIIMSNINKVAGDEFSDHFRVVESSVELWLAEIVRSPGIFNKDDAGWLVFCDPPYIYDDWDVLLETIAINCPANLVVLESDRPISPTKSWSVVKVTDYGTTVVEILERAPQVRL